LIVMAFAMFFLHGLPAGAVQTGAPSAIQAARSKTAVVPAEDSGGDDGDDGDDSGGAE
jgi:hypothetical protein